MTSSRPITFLMNHREIILRLHCQNNRSLKITWKGLQKPLPDLSQTMSFNTFKQYFSVIAIVWQEFDQVLKEKESVIQKLSDSNAALKRQATSQSRTGETVIQKSSDSNPVLEKRVNTQAKSQRFIIERKGSGSETEASKLVKRVSGWNLLKGKDGYYRCYRKIRNQVYSIYVGKKLNIANAKHRIRKKEAELGLDSS